MSKLNKMFFTLLSILAFVILFTNIAKADTVRVTTETLNLREKPSTDSNIVALISIGEECEVISEEGDWYEVKYGDYTGYISKEYAELVGKTNSDNSDDDGKSNSQSDGKDTNTDANNQNSVDSENTVSDNSTSKDTTSDNTTSDNATSDNSSGDAPNSSDVVKLEGKINKNTNVKIVPLISSSNIASIKANEEVMVITVMKNWVYIQADEVSGWVRSDAITVTEVKENNSKDNDKNSDKGTDDNQDDGKDDENSSDKTNDDSKDSETSFEEKTMYTEDYVNIRKEPSTTADIIMTVEENTALKVVGEEGDWYKVDTSEGEAYVIKSALSSERTQTTSRGSLDRKANSDKTTENSSDSNKVASNTSKLGSEIVSYAKKFLGVPYVYGGATSSGFDCSGFTMYVFDHFGISMGHGAQMQSKLGKAVEANKNSKTSLLENLEVGDLVFFLDYETMDEIGHCGIYIGDGDFIHASSGSGYCVKINSLLPGEYYNTRYCSARRVI